LSGLAIAALPTGTTGGASTPTGPELLSTFEENNFNDRGNNQLSTSSTYTYDLANNYAVDLTGWSHTRNFAYGFVRNSAGSPNPTAVVSEMVPGETYAFKVYQYSTPFYSGSNPLSVNGISMGLTTQTESMEASLQGETTADEQGRITFTFTRETPHVNLSGLAVAFVPTGTTGGDDSESEMYDGVTWTVDTDYHCGGISIAPLEDNTVYGWIPSSEGETIDTCKTRCVTDPSCTAFVFRDSDLGCFWKRGTSEGTLHPRNGHDCYSYDDNSRRHL